MFDAGAVTASLTVDTSKFDKDMTAAEARVKRFEDAGHKVKLSAVFDTSSVSRARTAFAQLDNAISKDAMSRLRSSPQGSVLGALNALFSPHPVTGAPSPQQAASQGLLGKMVSAPGGGGPPMPNDSRISGSSGNGTSLGSVLDQAPGNVSTTEDRVKVVGAPSDNAITTTDRVNVTGLPTTGGTVTTEDTIKEKLDPDSTAQVEKDSGTSGDKSGQSFAAGFMGHLKNLLGKSVTDATEQAAGDSGDRSGTRFTVGFGGHMGPFFASLTKSFGDAGGKGGTAMGTGLLGGIGPGILGISAKLSGIVGLVGSALGALPALAGLVGTGMGVAMIGGLIAGAVATSPGLQKEFTSIGAQAKIMITQATAPIVPAIQAILSQVPGLLKQLEPQLASISAAIAPQLQQVFSGLIPIIRGLVSVMQAAAPAFGPFIGALESLVSNIFPGIATVVKATIPFITQFAGVLSGLGSDLGSLFATAAPAIGASMQILSGLLGLVGDLLPVVMKVADIFATALAPVFVDFTGVIRTLIPPLTLVGQVIASFAGAVIGDLASAFGAVATLIRGLAPSLGILASTLSSVFTVMENAGVFAVFGDTLENLAVPLANLVNALVTGLAPVLPVLVNAASQLVTVFVGALSAALGAVLTAVTPVVAVLAQAVTAVVGFLQNTGLLLPVMAGLALAFGPVSAGLTAMAAGVAAFAGSGFVAAISGVVEAVVAFAAAAEGATAAEAAMVAGELAIEAVNPLAWIAIAVAPLALLTAALVKYSAQSQTMVGEFAQQQQALNYNIAGYTQLAATVETASQGYAKFAASSTDAVRGGAAGAATLSNQLHQQAQGISASAVTILGKVTDLSQGLGVSKTVIEQWATAAGITGPKLATVGENVALATQQLVAFVNKNALAITATNSLGENVSIFGDDVFSATTQLDAFNAIWNTLVGNLLTKQEAVTTSNTAFDNLTQTIKSSGANSDSARQSFQQYIDQIGSSASTLEKQGASVSTVNGYLQGQIDNLMKLGPLNAGEKTDLANLKLFQDALANSTNGLNAQQKTLISQFEAHLIPDLQSMGANTPKVTGDISNLADSIIQTGNGSASTAGDRAQLIKDLENAGLNAKQATGFVNGLQGQINTLKGKVVDVGVNATAQGTLNAIAHLPGASPTSSALVFTGADGGFVTGGIPGKDSVLAMLMPGEVVVPAAMVQAGAVDFLKGSIPGFAAGGMVNLDGPGQWAAGNEGSWGQQTANAWAQAVKNAFEASAAKAVTAAQQGHPSAGPGGGSPAANYALAQALYPAYKGTAVMAAWNSVAMAESGWNQFARNPSSGAYGIPQALPESKLPFAGQAAGGSNPTAQIEWMWDYMASTYGGPIGAWDHEQADHWYGNGGSINEPVLGYGMHSGDRYVLGESGSEMVTPIGGTRGGPSAAEIRDLLKQLHADNQQIIAVGKQAPAATGAHVGNAISGAAHDASFRSRYPRGGS